ncbi:DUF4479 domain-containing protein [Bacillaceae bacterium SIJ1]|uniref:YtpR family tRNA-binding protein n=1 Tax=Litoribacterium kuwaitense TaxID=1398745 RepID=UPI0013EDD346|nr:DUF4479 family protein [Litoribacterium kuwaitense]NGP44205.1 DUF4479 domain-containing protein [Litoribacterium kuwaitense]
MNVYYNLEGIGDVLILSLHDEKPAEISVDRRGPVAAVMNQETDQIIGYNVFNVSSFLTISERGRLTLSDEDVERIQKIISEQGFSEPLDSATSAFVIGYVTSCEKHSNADHLSVCQVDIGAKEVQIVCGAPNIAQGQTVVVATPGAIMPSGLLITTSELRGELSAGMICSAKELQLKDAPNEKGILVLDGETYKAGDAYQ